jgi:PAS domain-containing protein
VREPQRRRGTAEPDGEFRRLTGRTAGIIYILGGLIVAAETPMLPSGQAGPNWIVAAVGIAGVAAGAVMLRLPWHRWPQRASLCPTVPGLALIGVGNWTNPDPYLAAVFFFLLAIWLGTAQPRGTVLVLSPLFALAYWWPMSIVPHTPGLAHSVPSVIAVCVLAGESLAWLTARLHATQRRLREHDERRFQALLAASSDATVLLDPTYAMTYVSPSAVRVLYRPVDDLRRQGMTAFIRHQVHPDDAAALIVTLDHLFRSPGAEETMQFRVASPGGGWGNIDDRPP